MKDHRFPRLYSLTKFLSPKAPFAQLILVIAIRQWKILSVNVITNISQAVAEGASLSTIFYALKLLTDASSTNAPKSHDALGSLSANYLFDIFNDLSPSTRFFALLGLAIFLKIVQSACQYINMVSVGYFSASCRAQATARIHNQVLKLTYPSASSYKTGELTDYVSTASESIRIQIEHINLLVSGICFSVIYLLLLLKLSSWLLLFAALIIFIVACIQKYLLPKISSGATDVANSQANIVSLITEDFQALRLLHSSGTLEFAKERLRNSINNLEGTMKIQARRMSIIPPILSLLPIVAIAAVTSASILIFGFESATILPSLVTFVLALQRLSANLNGIVHIVNVLTDNGGRLNRLNTILSTTGKQYRRIGGVPFNSIERSIRFKDVKMKYDAESDYILNGLTFDIPVSSTLAIVGSSGSGKSTILDLLLGLYYPTSGTIAIDSSPLDQICLSSWQNKIGVVSQDSYLFNRSIYENLTFGLGAVAISRVREVCMISQANEFIDRLPLGLDTMIGDRGYRLSGGQRQRLAIARALLREPELLILDEATSALDSATEARLQCNLEDYCAKTTSIIVAHRLSTIVKATQIIVLHNGVIEEQGSHQKLMASHGSYRRLWDYQNQL
jgi:subfamily B ATP-binding cassette protein MsbA